MLKLVYRIIVWIIHSIEKTYLIDPNIAVKVKSVVISIPILASTILEGTNKLSVVMIQ